MKKSIKVLGATLSVLGTSALIYPLTKLGSQENNSVFAINESELNNNNIFNNYDRSEINLSLVGEFVEGKGIYGLFNPAIVKGAITIDPGKQNSQEEVFKATKVYTENLLGIVKTLFGYDIKIDTLVEMIKFEYYSDENGQTLQNNDKEDIKSFKISIIPGKEDTIDGLHVYGNTLIKTKLKTSLSDAIKVRKINEKILKEALLKQRVAVLNNLVSLDRSIEIKDFDKDNKTAQVIVGNGFNNAYYDDQKIVVTFK
ncbi:hypothetical protein SLITO_v1c07070 [Spiroplasma litorale]|uniref:Uncharacterized protein n=1 Tax=Spiroplasma litorale TaxID=216942 RepID=A0A0K1W2M5_9MOLU|nr:hypothetical protein [Spiroplasma litorale]AKX34332.1 hypothetical protein SLITO_v1c07070 [Spiroplasma litorale]